MSQFLPLSPPSISSSTVPPFASPSFSHSFTSDPLPPVVVVRPPRHHSILLAPPCRTRTGIRLCVPVETRSRSIGLMIILYIYGSTVHTVDLQAARPDASGMHACRHAAGSTSTHMIARSGVSKLPVRSGFGRNQLAAVFFRQGQAGTDGSRQTSSMVLRPY